MKTFLQIQRQLSAGEFEFSRHAFRRTVERNISEQEIREAGAKAEVIENYPDEQVFTERAAAGFYVGWTAIAFSGIFWGDGYGKNYHDLRA